jgi:hypothetical protein
VKLSGRQDRCISAARCHSIRVSPAKRVRSPRTWKYCYAIMRSGHTRRPREPGIVAGKLRIIGGWALEALFRARHKASTARASRRVGSAPRGSLEDKRGFAKERPGMHAAKDRQAFLIARTCHVRRSVRMVRRETSSRPLTWLAIPVRKRLLGYGLIRSMRSGSLVKPSDPLSRAFLLDAHLDEPTAVWVPTACDRTSAPTRW